MKDPYGYGLALVFVVIIRVSHDLLYSVDYFNF